MVDDAKKEITDAVRPINNWWFVPPIALIIGIIVGVPTAQFWWPF